ncbi:helix-turn-helix transcriptional regulator [Amycolatopsis sp. NPDC051371]|uniref:helix-turn-helix domain-containing protein n=1 Tax=Amycolatopsis sp. NPDC051371 TaxID=3155800 RepID=UPI003420FD42
MNGDYPHDDFAALERRRGQVLERVERLSGREREILALLGHGLSNRGIARRLGISERTVKFHVSNVLIKLRVESRLQAGSVAVLLLARPEPPGLG